MNNLEEKREFERFLIGLSVHLSTVDGDGNTYIEKTRLKEVSGGGARFTTRQAGRYFPGQVMQITIDLPGIEDVKAHMMGKATVVRVVKDNKDTQETDIAVSFSHRLAFFRD